MQLEQFLCEELSVTKLELTRFISSAPNKYKVYTIPKRTSGERTIAHPSKQLKQYQKTVIKKISPLFKIHNSSYAYRKGIGIKNNAKQHCKNRYLLKMDFQNFFHSINPNLLFVTTKNLNIEISEMDKKILTQLLFWRPSKKNKGKLILSIGAPSSPFISNSIMYQFDKEISEICKKNGIKYTRYADDLTFSTNIKKILFETPSLVKNLLYSHFSGHISINETKTVFSSKAHNRHVTGITLTNEGTLSIGRKRKRYISSLVHKFTINEFFSEDISYIQGLLNFAFDIEPEFINKLERKYSKDIMIKLRKGLA